MLPIYIGGFTSVSTKNECNGFKKLKNYIVDLFGQILNLKNRQTYSLSKDVLCTSRNRYLVKQLTEIVCHYYMDISLTTPHKIFVKLSYIYNKSPNKLTTNISLFTV